MSFIRAIFAIGEDLALMAGLASLMRKNNVFAVGFQQALKDGSFQK